MRAGIPWPWGHDQVIMTPLAQNVTFEREMASNSASPLRVELRNVEDLHASSTHRKNGAAQPITQTVPRSGFAANAAFPTPGAVGSVPPFAALAARHGRPLRVAILSDFTRIPYANGAAFQTRFLYQELRRCGHEVTVIGPRDPDATPDELAPGTIELPSVPLKTYPGVHIPLPLAAWVYDPARWNFDQQRL